MVRAGHTANSVVLPKVQFEKVEDEVSSGGPPGVQDGQARAFGYNDGYAYVRPDLYIRHIEPLEIDLARQVEYDMDEQDEEWLEAVNIERKKEHMDRVSPETFEIIMDRLEKEWFDLTKNLPKSDLAMPSEDSTCAVCDDSEGENSNAIVFCDGCNLAVHQDCYGVPYIPEGQWLCRKCTVSPENPVQCYLCPNEGGAFKQTIHGEWVHLLCAIWVPETRVANDVFMEPITGIEKISKQRWKLRCSICEVREGACIQCAKSSCFVAFHATCARQEKLLLPMKTTQGAETATLQAYCERHLPKEQQDIRAAALAAAENEQTDNKHSQKAARAYNKTYKPGPPIVPAIIVNRINQYTNRIRIRKKVELVQMICRYWSLKREARRGAPLLKRLHLEPWTASGGKIQTVEEKRMKLEQLKSLRKDLTYVKMLTMLIKFRELRKLKQTEITHQILSLALYPHEAALRIALETIMGADKQDFFKNPVDKNDVPDYFEIVLNPMCWSIIEDRLDKHEYWDIGTFKDDIDLVINNALLYNAPGTPFYKAALRIRSVSQNMFKNLEKLALPAHALPRPPEIEGTPSSSLPLIGDLETPLEVLELLQSSNAIQSGLNIELSSDPITSLLNMEGVQYKPAPPPSPIVPPAQPTTTHKSSKKSSKKRDRKAEAERAKARKEAAAAAARASASQTPGLGAGETAEDGMEMKVEVATTPGLALEFKEPRATRATLAMAAAFEREAHGGVLPSPVDTEASHGQGQQQAEAGPSKPPRKRPSVTLPTGSIPRVVDDVDNQGSFAYFNTGWILPSDHKRHGRAAVDKSIMPPPRKRQKTDQAGSRRPSGTSVATSDAHGLSSPIEGSMQGDDTRSSRPPPSSATTTSTKMEIDPFKVRPGQAFPPGASFEEGVTQRTSMDPSGRVVIEELDTPATRRAKQKEKKERQRQKGSIGSAAGAAAAGLGGAEGMVVDGGAEAGSAAPSGPAKGAGGGRAKGGKKTPGSRKVSIEEPPASVVDGDGDVEFLSDSDMSALTEPPSEGSPVKEGGEENADKKGKKKQEEEEEEDEDDDDEDDDEEEERPPQPPVPVLNMRKKPVEARRGKGKRVPDNYESGTLVWAKAESYPWWPAVVFDADHADVPPKVLAGYKETRTRKKVKLYIVRFYDRNNSWQYLAREKLQLLGENMRLDSDMISPNSVNQKWKSSSVRTTCGAAYRKALSEMETKTDDVTAFEAQLNMEDEKEKEKGPKGKG